MVTASHNPPSDNGYKVYDSDGGQIVAPVDAEISACIDHFDSLAGVEVPPLSELRQAGRVRAVPGEVRSDYVASVLDLRVHPEAPTSLEIVYTPLHGVGRELLVEVLGRAGYRNLHVVAEQAEPDGAFPTVRFPNPEEPGALDLAVALAESVGADLVIANDPDADRLAVVVPTPHGWHRLSGNEVGVLLAEDLLARDPGGPTLVATTLVSSALLSRIAAAHGSAYAETLTGFKWIARAARGFEGRFVLGYEEALGYSVGGLVRDKDGISAALILCDLAATLAARGRSLCDALDELHLRHGVHVSGQRSVGLPGADGRQRMQQAMAALRRSPPAALAGCAVLAVRDVLAGTRTPTGGAPTALTLPRSDVLGFELQGGHRVHIRPSGTEPKLKIYAEAVVAVGEGTLADARSSGADRMAALLEDTARCAGLTPAGG
jgi:phosphomannomutase